MRYALGIILLFTAAVALPCPQKNSALKKTAVSAEDFHDYSRQKDVDVLLRSTRKRAKPIRVTTPTVTPATPAVRVSSVPR